MVGIKHAINLNLDDISKENLKINTLYITDNEVMYHTVEFSEFHQNLSQESNKLEVLLPYSKLVSTGKLYGAGMFKDNK